ncbi:4-coumarate-- ligase-like 7, partial [Fusarium albosuccineum]
IDFVTAIYGAHRLSGIVTPANAAYSVTELSHQLKSSGAKALITCMPLMDTALEAAKAAGIPVENIFIFDIPGVQVDMTARQQTVERLVEEGSGLPELDPLLWVKGQGARQPAFLCYSSGTSGLPHATYESLGRQRKGVTTQAVSGFLPFSHIYGLVIASHTSTWRGDEVIVLPKFELRAFLASIQRFKIRQLLLVPPVILQLLQMRHICAEYDLNSVQFLYSGAAPLGEETIREIQSIYPGWTIGQAYGMTETATVVSSPSEHDIFNKASGSLLPGVKAKIIDMEGNEITRYDMSGELLVQAPSVTLGYLNNEKATAETFVFDKDGRWIRTGDEALITLAPSGNEHLVIVDRIKELIKGHQVAPAELEAHILAHPAVSDCAVIQVPDDRSGEVPKAFVVRTSSAKAIAEVDLAEQIARHVADHKAPYKQLKGGVEFLDSIPKSPSGKILRRLLRDREKGQQRARSARL